MDHLLQYTGKVRDIYKLGDDYLLMKATDRVSSFDKHIGTIPGKGELLNKMSEFWFRQTQHIIDNHLISTQDDVALVHKCNPFMIEVVVRGYIAGNTSTSLWTHYNKGIREYCGITFPDGLKKNQKLDSPVITPTTKGDVDIPMSKEELIQNDYITEKDYDYIAKKALELFEFGQKIADTVGFILVDTKYEFGKNKNGEIILIDEVHTCDSSRYWLKASYEELFNASLEPEKLDKDCVRDWVKSQCDPYKDNIPDIPEHIIEKAHGCYKYFYDTIVGETHVGETHVGETPKPPLAPLPEFNDDRDVGGLGVSPTWVSPTLVVILSGSDKDGAHVFKIENALNMEGIEYVSFVSSAHKNTREVLNIIERFDNDKKNNLKIIWVTVAGRSNALSGVVAANSKYPVIACPPFADKMDMFTNINSTLQCPSNVPVMTILEPSNVALAIKKIFAL